MASQPMTGNRARSVQAGDIPNLRNMRGPGISPRAVKTTKGTTCNHIFQSSAAFARDLLTMKFQALVVLDRWARALAALSHSRARCNSQAKGKMSAEVNSAIVTIASRSDT